MIRELKLHLKFASLMLIVIGIGGCVNSRAISTPDGKKGYAVDCSGTMFDWGHCYDEAAKVCGGKGFKIIDKSSNTGYSVYGNQYGIYGDSTISRNMIIQCKN